MIVNKNRIFVYVFATPDGKFLNSKKDKLTSNIDEAYYCGLVERINPELIKTYKHLGVHCVRVLRETEIKTIMRML